MPGPVFRHEMLAAGRKRRYLVLRVVFGLLLLVFLGFNYRISSAWAGHNEGASIAASSRLMSGIFATFAWGTLLGVLGLTPAIAAGAIASERQRRTIEYLFTSQLTNAEIVLDKLLARLLTVGQLVLATLPILAICRLMGGLPGELLLWHFATLATTTLITASIALVVSTWCERARNAVPRAYGMVFLWLVSGGLLAGLATILQDGVPWLANWILGPLAGVLMALNPFLALASYGMVDMGAFGVGFDPTAVKIVLASQLGASALLLGVCVMSVRRVHLNAAGGSAKSVKMSSGGARRVSPYESCPVLWKEMFAATTPKRRGRWVHGLTVLLLFLLIALPLGWALWESLVSSNSEAYSYTSTWLIGLLGSLLALMAGGRAAGLIPYEREQQTWLTLTSTPLTGSEIIYGKLLGNLYACRWAFGGITLIAGLNIVFDPKFVLAFFGVLVAVIATTFAASAIGLSVSLDKESSTQSIGWTTGLLIFLGGGYLLVLGPLLVFAGGDEWILLLTPCVPYLLLAPFFLFFEGAGNNAAGMVGLAYFLGVAGYASLGAMLTQGAIGRLNQYAGSNSATSEPSAAPLPT